MHRPSGIFFNMKNLKLSLAFWLTLLYNGNMAFKYKCPQYEDTDMRASQ